MYKKIHTNLTATATACDLNHTPVRRIIENDALCRLGWSLDK